MFDAVVSAQIVKGKLTLGSRLRDRLAEQIRQLKDGPVTVTVARKHATRSVQANRYWWGVCLPLVAEHTGYTVDECHDIAKQMFLPKKLAITDGNGEIKGEFVVGGTTRSLTTLEFYEFVENWRKWAGQELGVTIPDPDEDYWMTKGDAA